MNIIIQNIKRIAENEGITITKMEHEIGASKGVLSRAIGNNSDIQCKWILKVVENYPEYSCEWLIKDEGPMIREINKDYSQQYLSEIENEICYKILAASRKETIDSLQKVIYHLEKQITLYEKEENNNTQT